MAMVAVSHCFVCVRETLPLNRAVERGSKGYRVPRPGLLQGTRAVVKRNVDWFWLLRVLHLPWYLDLRKLPIDIEIKISKLISTFDLKKKKSSPHNRSVHGCFALRCKQFQPRSFLGKICRLSSDISDFTKSLSMGARN